MNSGVTLERVYDELRHRLLTGHFRPGDRLEPAALAEDLASSTTPVRDALYLLYGKGLLEAWPGGGFHVPQVSEPALRDLYFWSSQVLLLAGRVRDNSASVRDLPQADAASETGALFAAIAEASENVEHAREVRSINDRLYAARLAEVELFGDWRSELGEIRLTWEGSELPELRRTISRYHRQRARAVPEIVRLLYRNVPSG